MMTEDDQPRDSTRDAPRDRQANTADATEASSASLTYHRDSEQSFVLSVIHLLAETLDEDPITMRPPLGDVIDPEILERLQQADDKPEQTFTFEYRDYVVTATNHGVVNVRQNPSHVSS